MRRLILLVISVGCALFSVSCGGGGGPTFADLRWQVRCPSDITGCSAGDAQDIFGFDGKPNDGTSGGTVQASCTLDKFGDGQMRLSFFAGVGADTRVTVRNAIFPEGGGGITGPGCSIDITDDAITYEGTCGTANPSADQECQFVGGVVLDREDEDGKSIKVDILCRNITSPADAMRFRRDVVAPMTRDEPFSVRFLDCDGF